MILFKKAPFTFEEKDYEIKVFYNDKLVNVVAFENNYPANGLRHQIKISKNLPVKQLLEQDVIEELVELSKKDISEKRWERFLEKSGASK